MFAADQTGSAQQQIVVVTGETFKKPEQLGVVFLRVVVTGEFRWPQAFDVPGVKVLMADQPQQRGVAIRRQALSHLRQISTFTNQGCAVTVLQATVAFMDGVEHEQVVFMWCLRLLLTVPECNFSFANGLGVRQQTCPVKTGWCTRDDEPVRNTSRDK